ncbi:MAG: acylneuraminate cytidylyltransferase family protein [Gammaproteobacteria bacterium]|nr:acylneuraminate cytidylyltransferase family protein [Gammaproteobacteria bacterium]
MIDGKKILALIPARDGSKGLPRKNILPICGKPLITWSVEKALKSKFVDIVLVTTDSLEIADIARAAGAHVPFIRPAELATDLSPTYDAIRHALGFLEKEEGRTFDYVVLLEPTSPLRQDDDIDRMLEQLVGNSADFDSIISVGEVEAHPSIVRRLSGPNLEPFCPELQRTSRRQDNEPAFFPYGVAYIAKTTVLLAENTFYTKRCTYFKIKQYQNYEIDDIYGFLCVESIMKYEWGLK